MTCKICAWLGGERNPQVASTVDLMQMPGDQVLTLNTGSSSLKIALYDTPLGRPPLLSGVAGEIGGPNSSLVVTGANERTVGTATAIGSHVKALETFVKLASSATALNPNVIGHRVVHGGDRYAKPVVVDDTVLSTLRELVVIDPDHLPQALACIEWTLTRFPRAPNVACFDTAFHQTMPRVARLFPLPRKLADEGLLRFGFHGLSCEYILSALKQEDADLAKGRVIVAHLGNGASLTAIRDAQSVENTMGFTPTGGVMMGTRSGDLDPGALLYLQREGALDAAATSDVVNKRSGLPGVSDSSSDVRQLLDVEKTDTAAKEALDLFCYEIRKSIGALAAVLEGLDVLVFTAGIGEHAPSLRRRMTQGLGFLGIEIDEQRNHGGETEIQSNGSKVKVRVMRTDEDSMIARHALAVVEEGKTSV